MTNGVVTDCMFQTVCVLLEYGLSFYSVCLIYLPYFIIKVHELLKFVSLVQVPRAIQM